MEDRHFIESDEKSSEIDREVLSLMTSASKTKFNAFLKEQNITLRLTEWTIMNIIGAYNSNLRNTTSTMSRLKSLKKYGLRIAKIEDDILKLEFRGIRSSAYPIYKILSNTDFLMDFYVRQGQCHNICLNLVKGMDLDCSVLTGFNYGLTSGSKYLHSVIKLESEGFPRIIDTTINSMLDEGFYKELLGFETLTEIPSSQIRNDFDLMVDNGKIDLKEYFLYRDEYVGVLKERKDAQKQGDETKTEIVATKNDDKNQKNKA